jgi:hypothetical protein
MPAISNILTDHSNFMFVMMVSHKPLSLALGDQCLVKEMYRYVEHGNNIVV